MTIMDDVNKVISFHPQSPQFSFYYQRTEKKLRRGLYDSVYTPREFQEYMDKMNNVLYSGRFEVTEWLASVMDAYERMDRGHSFLDLYYKSNLAVTKSYSEEVSKVLKGVREGAIETSKVCAFMVKLLVTIKDTMKNPDRRVYIYIKEFEYVIFACLRDRAITEDILKCVNVYAALKEIVLNDDKDFYEDFFESICEGSNRADDRTRWDNGIPRTIDTELDDKIDENVINQQESLMPEEDAFDAGSSEVAVDREVASISKSSVFDNATKPNDDVDILEEASKVSVDYKINSYLELQKVITKYYVDCLKPYQERVWDSKKVYSAILNSDISDSAKMHFNSIFSSESLPITNYKRDFKEVFFNYNSFGKDCVFLSTRESLIDALEFCEFLERLTTPHAIISYCVAKADLEFLATHNAEARNFALIENLERFESSGLISNIKDIYFALLDKFKWR